MQTRRHISPPKVVKYAPGYVYGWSNRANVRIAEGDLTGAISDYDRALELADSLDVPDKWIIHLNRCINPFEAGFQFLY